MCLPDEYSGVPAIHSGFYELRCCGFVGLFLEFQRTVNRKFAMVVNLDSALYISETGRRVGGLNAESNDVAFFCIGTRATQGIQESSLLRDVMVGGEDGNDRLRISLGDGECTQSSSGAAIPSRWLD